MAEQKSTNGWEVARIAFICCTICVVTMFGTASDWSDLSEVKTGGISTGTVAAVLFGLYKTGKL